MKYTGIVQGSRTVDVTVIVGALGLLEANFHLLQDLLGKWYGLSYVVLAVVFYVLRRVTTTPLGEKKRKAPQVKVSGTT